MFTRKITRKYLTNFLKEYQTTERVLDIVSSGSAYGILFSNRLTLDIDPNRKSEIVGDAQALLFDNESFSYILCTEVLEDVKDSKKVIYEIYRVLKNDGVVILTTRFIFPIPDSPNDFWRFTPYSLRMLFESFEIERLETEAVDFASIAVLLQRMGYQCKFKLNKITNFFIFFLARIFFGLNFLIKKSFGDINQKISLENIMSSGYYAVALKKY